jgi:NAD(P)-dependent dehydrogenase (short-subunit alcohol dehydrogenase family)
LGAPSHWSSRGKDRLESVARQARALGVSALPIAVDVADHNLVDAAAEHVENELGPIDVWINNAMVTIFAPVHEVEPEEFHRVTMVTYLGQVHGTMAALRRMRRRNRGTIIQVGSALSYRAIPLQSAYCGAKFAVRGFTDSLRTELAHEGSQIRLTMVQLPAVNTPQFDWARSRMPKKLQPLPPIFQPEAIARDIVKAARDRPRELWIGRSSLKAIIGTLLLPRLGDYIVSTEGYRGQMTDEPRDGTFCDNLFAPPPGDPGAHGRFDDRAELSTVGFDPSWLRAGALCVVLGLIAGAFAAGRSANGGRRHHVRRAREAHPAR